MTPPDEVVCESEGRFIYEVRKHVDYHQGGKVMPGDSVTVGGKRIVYRPKPSDRCPRCGSSDRNTYIHSSMPPHDFHAPCFHDGDYHPWHAVKDVAPRDEAREAFEAWFGQFVYPGDLRSDLRAAFLAGRASVKP